MTSEWHDPELSKRLAVKVMGWVEWDGENTKRGEEGHINVDGSPWITSEVRPFDPCCIATDSWLLEKGMVIKLKWEKRSTWYPPDEFHPKGRGVVGFVKYRSREERERIEKLPFNERMKFSGPEFSHHIEFPLYGSNMHDVSGADPLHAMALAADAAVE